MTGSLEFKLQLVRVRAEEAVWTTRCDGSSSFSSSIFFAGFEDEDEDENEEDAALGVFSQSL